MAEGKFIGMCVLWVFALLILILNVLMNIFARSVLRVTLGMFETSVQDLIRGYDIDMAPADWVHWYWCAIGGWQGLWMFYGASTMCRKGIDNKPLMVSPELISIPVYCLFTFGNCLHIGSLFLWDRGFNIQGTVFNGLLMVTMWTACGISCWDLSKNLQKLYEEGLQKEAWLIRAFLHNGLAMTASYTTVGFFFNLNVLIQFESGYNYIDSTTVCLSLLMFFIVVYFILDITILDQWLRYVYMPYVTVGYIFGSIIQRKWGPVWLENYRNPTFVATSLGVVCVLALTKLLIMSIRSAISPVKPDSNSTESLIADERGYK